MSYASREEGAKRRIRPESFADHYSQARQFYVSQTPVEQHHLQGALIFELSKVERAEIRVRMVSHLRNIDDDLAQTVADKLGIDPLPPPAPAAKMTNKALPVSDALSILKNGPKNFAGRRVGALISDGVDIELLTGLREALVAEGATLKLVAPRIANIEASDGSRLDADETVEGGPSVLFDAVALLPSKAGAATLARQPAVRDFVADAFAHCKFIACGAFGAPLLAAAGVTTDGGVITISAKRDFTTFVQRCRELRYFDRM